MAQATSPLPVPPPVPGLAFRYARGADDAAALHAVHSGRAGHDRVERLSRMEDFPNRDELAAALGAAAAAGRHDRWLIAEAGGRAVGYSCLESWPERDGTRVYLTLGWVLPEWRGHGIGSAMLAWAEARLRELHGREHAGEPAELAANASSTEPEATALLLDAGYRAAYNVLALKLEPSTTAPAVPLPPGLEVRPATADHLPAIAACIYSAYRDEYDGGRFDETEGIEGELRELQEARHDPRLWRVAWDGDRVVGQVLPVLCGSYAEIYEVSVHPDWRRSGLARSLLAAALADLRGRGIETVMVHTVEEFRTHAKDLYAGAGFRLVKRFPRYRKPW